MIKQKNKTALVYGNFNVLHPGHLRLFRFAKQNCEKLVVAVNSDLIAGSGSYIDQKLRLEGVKSNTWVDEALLNDTSIQELILNIEPALVVKGSEHEFEENPELSAINKVGARLMFCSGERLFSSVNILNKNFSISKEASFELPFEYMHRHRISKKRLKEIVNSVAKIKVCVIGDLIIDEYITCQPLGLSREEPTIVVTPLHTDKFLGGAGIVAGHSVSLGAHTNLLSVCGNDAAAEYGKEETEKFGISPSFVIDEERLTTVKQRYRSEGKSLLRVNHLNQNSISLELQDKLFNHFKKIAKNLDLVIFSDFNYGCLPQRLVDLATQHCLKSGILMTADSQSSSQIGDIARFKGAGLVTPTEHEARISVRNNEYGLVVLVRELQARVNCDHILLKLGAEGVLIYTHKDNDKDIHTDRISALNSNPKDVAGAGDSMLVGSSMALATGATIWEAALLGAMAASIQVGRVGNLPIGSNEMLELL